MKDRKFYIVFPLSVTGALLSLAWIAGRAKSEVGDLDFIAFIYSLKYFPAILVGAVLGFGLGLVINQLINKFGKHKNPQP
jgi:hypothetical protein